MKFGFLGFLRNGVLSIVSITILTMAILSSFLLLGSVYLADSVVSSIESKFDFSLDFKKETTEFEISEVENFLQNLPEVRSYQIVTSEESIQNLLNQLGRTDLQDVDLNFPSSVKISLYDSGDWSKVLDKISQSTYSEKFENLSKTLQTESQKLDKLSKIVSKSELFLAGLVFYFLFLAIVIIFNTTKLSIESRSREIEIMKLVGASRGFIVNPFIFEALISGAISVFLSFSIISFILKKFNTYISNIFLDVTEINLQSIFEKNLYIIFPVFFISTFFLIVINTQLSIKKFLKF